MEKTPKMRISTLPALSTFDQNSYSDTDANKHRIYRGSQAVDVVMSLPGKIDRRDQQDVQAMGGLAGDLVTGSDVIAVARFPLCPRDIFVP